MKRVLVIGSSTGGPNALELVFGTLPKDFLVPILVAQHLTAPFTKVLATRLHKVSKIPVSEVRNHEIIKAGRAYIVPGDSHFFLAEPNSIITLIPATDLPKPSIDMGLTSVAEHFGPGTIAVILSGMGADGVVGAKVVKQVGGYVIVQDEATSVIYGMPKAVRDAGFADEVLPIEQIIPRIVHLISAEDAQESVR